MTSQPTDPLVLTPDLIGHLVDEDGRPLGEHAVAPSSAEQVRCPYEGSRAGLLINQSALRQLAARFEAARAVFGAAHDLVTLPLVRAEACFVLPLLVAQPVPGAIAVASKAAKGLRPVLRGLLLERALDDDDGALTPQRILDYAELTGALVGGAEACAAPPAMIIGAVSALLHGCGGAQPATPAVDVIMWREIATARTRLEVTRVVAWAARWWLRAVPARARTPARSTLPLHGPSVDDRLRALPKDARTDVVMRLRPLVDEMMIAAIRSNDLDGAEQALLAAAQSAEDIQRRLLGFPRMHLGANIVTALLGRRPP